MEGYSQVAFEKKKPISTRAKALYDRSTGVGLPERVEQVLWWNTLHVGRTIGAEGLRCSLIALTTALDLVQDDTGHDNEEDAAQGAAEGHQDHEAVGVMCRCGSVSTGSKQNGGNDLQLLV